MPEWAIGDSHSISFHPEIVQKFFFTSLRMITRTAAKVPAFHILPISHGSSGIGYLA